ncbi:MAG: hypothetical protein PWP31_1098 [Clostridia bacterium]|nr:hypothetical protein [Clostridia bacterium]
MKNEVYLSNGNSFINNMLQNRLSFRIRFLLEGALIGIFAGIVGVGFRLTLTEGEILRNNILNWARTVPGCGWLVLPLLGILAAGFAGWLTGFAPETAGSGIPHVEAVLTRQRKMIWWRILPIKFIAGALAIGTGLSLGREGPTIQMGAATGQFVSKTLKRTKSEELQLIVCGAGAGLAAAFNAPLAGLLFVLEEVRRNFSPYIVIGALAASIAADTITHKILGPIPTFRVNDLSPLPLTTLPIFLVLGILTGVFGSIFNKSLEKSLDLSDKILIPRWMKAMLVAIGVGIIGYFLPEVLGGGHLLVENILKGQIGLNFLLILFAVKFILTMVSYSVGVPGGIFLPLLVLGALLGSFVAGTSNLLLPSLHLHLSPFVVIGMAAFFVAIVRAPITGIVLILEMTGDYQHMLFLLFTCVISYMVAEALGTLPVYEMLLERDLANNKGEALEPSYGNEMLLLEIAAESGSNAIGSRVKDLALPKDCLLISIRRGSQEIIPRGYTRILEGDHLTVVVPDEKAPETMKELNRVVKSEK